MATHYGRQALEILTSNCDGWEDIDDGDQLKFNHSTCHAGEDTKERLYVKKMDGAFLFHCHNCGDSGFYRPRETYTRIKESTEVRNERMSRMDMIRQATTEDFDDFKIEGQLWLTQYGFDDEMCRAYGIAECDTGLMLPVYGINLSGGVATTGCQVRNYGGKGPKYVTYTDCHYSYLQEDKDCIVLTEDLLSSYKLHWAGWPTLCLLGTKLALGAQRIVTEKYKRAILWLDDDAAGHDAALKLLRELSPVVPGLTAIFNKQPKEIDIETLQTMEL